jgi:pilus assembly protein CpaC
MTKFIALLLFVSLTLALGGGAALAAADPEQIVITVGKSHIIETPADIERVAVATDDVVEAVAITQREIVLNAKGPGETSVIIWQHNGAGRLSYNVTVEPSTSKTDSLRRRLRAEVGDTLDVDMVDKSVLLRGLVRSQIDGDKAMAIAAAYGVPVNLMTIATPSAVPQILLKVRFASVDRSASLSLGMNLLSTGAGNTVGGITTGQFSPPTTGSVAAGAPTTFTLTNALNVFLFRPDLNLGATIEALEAKNLVEILAEPNVLAADGVPASFLAGGEFPYPVVQSSTNGISNVTIQFREFGIRLNFTPTITPRGTIKLEVAPEVSSLDYANGLTYQGFNIPGLDVRRVKTEIELENNQSFAIAGLLDNQVTENLSKVPGLGDIPLLGKLFQSISRTKSNSEVLVVVTPEIVQPLSATTSAPTLTLPSPFLKDTPAHPDQPNPPAGKALPVQSQVPFEPTSEKKAAPKQNAEGSMSSVIKDALKKEQP